MTIRSWLAERVLGYKAQRPPVKGEASRSDPSRLWVGGATIYNPDSLVSRHGYIVYDEMRRDDQVKGALAFKKQSVMAAGWRIVAPEGKDDATDPPTLFLRDMLKRLEGSFDKSMLQILSALDYGFSVTEPVWEERNGKVVISALKTRKPHEWELRTDPYGNLLSPLKQAQWEVPADRVFLYSYDFEFGNHYGRSDLNAAYRDWWIKKNSYLWMSMLLERLGIPPVFALYNPDAYQGTKVDALNKLLQTMQASTVGSIPRGAPEDLELWAPELAGQVASVFLPAIDKFNQGISRSLLMPGLVGMGPEQQTGSLARAEVHFDVFMLVLAHLRRETTDLINDEVCGPALDYNFNLVDDERPRFEWNPLTEDDRQQIMTTWATLVGAKVVQTQDSDETHVRQMLKFPELDQKDADSRTERSIEDQAKRIEAMPKPEGPPQEVKKASLDADQFAELLEYVFDPSKGKR